MHHAELSTLQEYFLSVTGARIVDGAIMKIIDADITSLDLECVSYKACRDEGWSRDKVDRIEKEYRAFLQVLKNADRSCSLAPTLDIDKYWHHHILDTYKYYSDCHLIFGYYVHHFPYSGIFGKEDGNKQSERVRNTLSLISHYLI